MFHTHDYTHFIAHASNGVFERQGMHTAAVWHFARKMAQR
jgi:hypothetical protein